MSEKSIIIKAKVVSGENVMLLHNIVLDTNSCFDVDYIFEFDKALYEKLDVNKGDSAPYRVIFSEDDYDYIDVERNLYTDLIKKLDIAFIAQA